MKSKVITINKILILSSLLFILFIILIYLICIDQTEDKKFNAHETSSKYKIINEKIEVQNLIDNKSKDINQNKIKLEEYVDIPRQYKGYNVIGKITIPKINIEKYILNETSEQALKVAVTKIIGPKANEIGNLCISGHNYSQTFGKLKELEVGDEIIITDTYSREIRYKIYDTYKVYPDDTNCLSQNTNGEREITLITCTLGAIKRNIIKAIEIYD